jgi:8-oxo-dGTP diphosphatase
MGKAVRAIVIEKDRILVMHRNKYGSEYFTLVGGLAGKDETLEQALVREVREETGLTVISGRLAYFEEHPSPYNEQYIYLCEVAPHGTVAIQEYSEEGTMNRYDMNTHQPHWVSLRAFGNLPFRTPQLQEAIVKALKKGFPKEPVKL